MIMLLVICAFSAFFASVICQSGGPYGWPHGWQSSWQPNGQPSWQPIPQNNFPRSSQPTSLENIRLYGREQIVDARGHTEVAFFRDGELFFIDFYLENLCSFHIATRDIFCVHIGQGHLTFAVPVEHHPDKFVVGCDKNILMIKWNSSAHAPSTPHYIFQAPGILPVQGEGERVGYGAIDYDGRLWFATVNEDTIMPDTGTLYLSDSNMLIERRLSDIGSVTGGFAWNPPPAGTRQRPPPYKFYYADTRKRKIISYHLTMLVAVLEKRRVPLKFSDFQYIKGNPGRIAIDSRGVLWLPLLGGGGVQEFDPFTGNPGKFIPIPASYVGGCTFGGPRWQTLYVSTIRFEFKETAREPPPDDEGGCIFAVHRIRSKGELVTGVPTREYHVDDEVLRVALAVLDPPSHSHYSDRASSGTGGSRGKNIHGEGTSHGFDINESLTNYPGRHY